MNEYKYTNRLINETSPYLLQHAHNPVDWHTWGEESLQLAKEKDAPILLSIGYSSCHWCHVMEKESFENEKIAKLMNDNFICIKVDREERPDLDEIYMNAVQAMIGSGGWPMTVFLTPDLKPFYAGTYFPPTDVYGKPGFTSIILAVSKFYKEQRDKVESYADQVSALINDMSDFARSDNPISKDILNALYKQAVTIYDENYGGFGSAPKFPQPMLLSFLMRYWKHNKEPKALDMVENTLKKMADGGIYDQLGSGFHRYSVDERWLVPHFEKMLYDNALLSRNYIEAYQITGNIFYRKIATETLDYVLREMSNQNRGFYSALDADSEGEEGRYYVWDIYEIKNLIDTEDADKFIKYYGLKTAGNFEHNKNILYVASPDQNIDDVLMRYKENLLEYRQKRVKPKLDDKIITSWNALMISSMAFAYQVLNEDKYLDSARQSAEFILYELSKDGMLLRTFRNNKDKLNGYADDYAFFISSLIDLYEATFELRWLKEAIRLTDIFINEFWDEENGGFFYTGKNHERLITRTKPIHDGAIPSANSVAMMNLLRLSRIIGNSEFAKKAETTFNLLSDQINQSPTAFTQMVCALDFYFGSPKEIVIVGKRNEPKVQDALRIIYERYIPNRVIVFYDPNDKVSDIEELIPLLKHRIDSEAILIIYICENNTCKNPITNLDELLESL